MAGTSDITYFIVLLQALSSRRLILGRGSGKPSSESIAHLSGKFCHFCPVPLVLEGSEVKSRCEERKKSDSHRVSENLAAGQAFALCRVKQLVGACENSLFSVEHDLFFFP